MERIALLVLGGHVTAQDIELAGGHHFVCAADSGLDCAKELEIVPDLAIGDFDSASASALEWAISNATKIIRHPAEKDWSDGELALIELARMGFSQVRIVGLLNGLEARPDHVLFNFGLFHLEDKLGIKIKAFVNSFEVFTVAGAQTVCATKGSIVSVLPFFGDVNITLEGLLYEFQGVAEQGSTRGLSNLANGDFRIEVKGKALIFVQCIPSFFQTLDNASTM